MTMFKKSATQKLESFNKGLLEDYHKYQELQRTISDLQAEIKSAVLNDVDPEKLIQQLSKRQAESALIQSKINALFPAKWELMQRAKQEAVDVAYAAINEHQKKF